MKKKETALRLIGRQQNKYGTEYFDIWIVIEEEGKPRNSYKSAWDNFKLDAFISDYDGTAAWHFRISDASYDNVYGMETELKWWKALNRKLKKNGEAWGYPKTFGEAIRHLARALDIDKVFVLPKGHRDSGNYDQSAWDIWGVETLIRQAEQWEEEKGTTRRKAKAEKDAREAAEQEREEANRKAQEEIDRNESGDFIEASEG